MTTTPHPATIGPMTDPTPDTTTETLADHAEAAPAAPTEPKPGTLIFFSIRTINRWTFVFYPVCWGGVSLFVYEVMGVSGSSWSSVTLYILLTFVISFLTGISLRKLLLVFDRYMYRRHNN